MKNQDNTDGWNDGWHTQACTADTVNTLRDSILGTAKAAVKSATTRDSNHDSKTKTREDGWSGDGQANASPWESLSALRDSSVEAAKSTAKMASTPEGWWKIAKGAGTVAAATATVGIVVVRNVLRNTDLHDEAKDLPCHADPSDPRNQPHSHIYYDHAGYPMDRAGFYHDDDDI